MNRVDTRSWEQRYPLLWVNGKWQRRARSAAALTLKAGTGELLKRKLRRHFQLAMSKTI